MAGQFRSHHRRHYCMHARYSQPIRKWFAWPSGRSHELFTRGGISIWHVLCAYGGSLATPWSAFRPPMRIFLPYGTNNHMQIRFHFSTIFYLVQRAFLYSILLARFFTNSSTWFSFLKLQFSVWVENPLHASLARLSLVQQYFMPLSSFGGKLS